MIQSFHTVIVGSGAAGLCAANQLFRLGQKDIAIVTEGLGKGTSRNTGSDKQTYYKLNLCGDENDSPQKLAQTLYSGGSMDGDHALIEASLSAECFFNLVQLGVPFPQNRYGEYIGYKTDHDPFHRATSIGPYTSKKMTEVLEEAVLEKEIPVLDNLQVVRILTKDNQAIGLICLDLTSKEENPFVVIQCSYIIYATGAPAAMYYDSVYPHGQHGASGIAFEAGVNGKNLTEWQYGLASIKPRWNVSGTYMQCLPSIISTNENGGDIQEFLTPYFKSRYDLLNLIFSKGYQWPFDAGKVTASSLIDIYIYIETKIKKRRVFLDFRKNHNNELIDFEQLSNEAKQYLYASGATQDTPVQRLICMNEPAYNFYKDRHIDLCNEILEISLCAQHNNGGLAVDLWWQTNVKNFFAIGEVSGTHGVYRPGGSALNAGQVGAYRAASYISQAKISNCDCFGDIAAAELDKLLSLKKSVIRGGSNIKQLLRSAQIEMSKSAAAFRNYDDLQALKNSILQKIKTFSQSVSISSADHLHDVFVYYDTLISQFVYVCAMVNYIEESGCSRGSAVYFDKKDYDISSDRLSDIPQFSTNEHNDLIQEIHYDNLSCQYTWRRARPIPKEDRAFEVVWRDYRNNKNIY